VQETSTIRPSASARLFVALWPDAGVRAQLAAQRDALRLPPGGRPVADTRLHLTLHFIGAFDRARLPALWTALSAVPARPVRLRADAIAVWHRGTVVLPLRGDAALAALHEEIGAALQAIGIPLEQRPFAPHVTLARAAAGVQLPTALPGLAWRATGFALVESTGGSAPAYRVLASR